MNTHSSGNTLQKKQWFGGNSQPQKRVLWVVIVVILVIAIGVAGFFAVREYLYLRQFKDERDVELLKEKLSKHYLLPEAEPIIATVTDAERLSQEQAFYKNAENGDKVFIWQDKALIYRNSEDRIVDFGIIVSPNQGQNQEPLSDASNAVSVSVLNGSGVANAANQVASEVSGSGIAQLSTNTTNASRDNYEETVVYNVSGAYPDEAQAIADLIGAGYSAGAPEGETIDNSADIAIIVGADFTGGTTQESQQGIEGLDIQSTGDSGTAELEP